MDIKISEIKNLKIENKTRDFYQKGGCLNFQVYQILKSYKEDIPTDKYKCHLAVARQTIAKIDNSFHFSELAQSGVEIKYEEFFGPFYDVKNDKPLIRGIKGNDTCNFYFYFDQEEDIKNKVNMQYVIDKYEKQYPNLNGYFIYAFMEPPYQLETGSTIQEKGEYLIQFLDFFFSNKKKLEIMKWSTDCSSYFDAGKEWWGSYFWTVYNPEKKWYIGIAGSSTD